MRLPLPASPVPRFAVLQLAGFVTLTLVAWMVGARWSSALPGRVEALLTLNLPFVWAAFAAWRAPLRRWSHAAPMLALAVLIHMVVFHLPLYLLFGVRMNPVMLRELAGIAGNLALGYAIAIAAVLLLTGILKRNGGLA